MGSRSGLSSSERKIGSEEAKAEENNAKSKKESEGHDSVVESGARSPSAVVATGDTGVCSGSVLPEDGYDIG